MIETQGLTKRFGGHLAVDDVTFSCQPGTVTGFLGPNGAGKSTTLRMICGLANPSGGSATVLGQRYRRIANPARHVGVMLDASAQHSGRTGRETLLLSAETMGIDRSHVPEWLERVGLDPSAAKKRVGKYSLGMRQRLGLAQVLIGDPQVLILDEPANGLDPQGIIWMRDLLRGFAEKGGTVLLSSHLLHEIDVIADQLVLINRGKIVAQGSKTELLATFGLPGAEPRPRRPRARARARPGSTSFPPATASSPAPMASKSAPPRTPAASRSASSAPPRAAASSSSSSRSPATVPRVLPADTPPPPPGAGGQAAAPPPPPPPPPPGAPS